MAIKSIEDLKIEASLLPSDEEFGEKYDNSADGGNFDDTFNSGYELGLRTGKATMAKEVVDFLTSETKLPPT